jgi:N-acetylglutamate synthase-like GNAT family acetyltransferase
MIKKWDKFNESISYKDLVIHRSQLDDRVQWYIMQKDGLSFIKAYRYFDMPEILSICDLTVREENRMNNLGSYLLDSVEDLAIKLGCEWTYLQAEKDSWMESWYSRRGYEPTEGDWMRKKI